MIDGIIKALKAYDDGSLHEKAKSHPGLMKEIVERYFYCG